MKILVLLAFAISAGATYEGNACTNDGVAGVCTNIENCPAALQDLRNNKRPVHCSFDGSAPIVCCIQSASSIRTTQRPSSTTTTEYVPQEYEYEDANVGANVDVNIESRAGASSGGCEPIPASLTSKKNGRKAWDKCLEYQEKLVFPCAKCASIGGGLCRTNRCHHNADELIIGGNAATANEFPHMALLGYGTDPSDLKWQCGGSLISDKFVLTAGHCISSRLNETVSHVQLGTSRRSSMPLQNRYRVRRVHRHPRYDPPNRYHDIALLELDRVVKLSEFLVPACLHTGARVNDTLASATGWGLTTYNDQRSLSNELQKVILTKFDDDFECAVTYPPFRHMLNGVDKLSQVCYGDRTKSRDTCQGDSGGPLQIKSKQMACMYTIVGVTSFGSACGFVGVPGIYTRVQHYVSWIEGIVWP